MRAKFCGITAVPEVLGGHVSVLQTSFLLNEKLNLRWSHTAWCHQSVEVLFYFIFFRFSIVIYFSCEAASFSSTSVSDFLFSRMTLKTAPREEGSLSCIWADEESKSDNRGRVFILDKRKGSLTRLKTQDVGRLQFLVVYRGNCHAFDRLVSLSPWWVSLCATAVRRLKMAAVEISNTFYDAHVL